MSRDRHARMGPDGALPGFVGLGPHPLEPRRRRWTLDLRATRKNGYVEYLVIAFFFGLATGIIGRAKGSSFFIWFVIGMVIPPLGLIAVIFYRVDKDEPERQCP